MAQPMDLARIRRELARKRHPEVIASVGILPARPVATTRPVQARLTAFATWRRRHYVADQALRVLAIAAVALLSAGLAIGALILAGAWLFGKVSGAVGAGGGLFIVAVAVVIVLAFRSGSSTKDSAGHSGYGFHYGPCDHK